VLARFIREHTGIQNVSQFLVIKNYSIASYFLPAQNAFGTFIYLQCVLLVFLDHLAIDCPLGFVFEEEGLHGFHDVLLAEFEERNVVFESTEESEDQLETDSGEDQLAFGDFAAYLHELDANAGCQLGVDCDGHEELKVRGN
jgi:hypothetical protein